MVADRTGRLRSWRMNWIHPFIEGNGRTARATCYYLLCVRSGSFLPGRKIVPERIREDQPGYEKALIAADRAWDEGHLDFSEMEDYQRVFFRPSLKTTACRIRAIDLAS